MRRSRVTQQAPNLLDEIEFSLFHSSLEKSKENGIISINIEQPLQVPEELSGLLILADRIYRKTLTELQRDPKFDFNKNIGKSVEWEMLSNDENAIVAKEIILARLLIRAIEENQIDRDKLKKANEDSAHKSIFNKKVEKPIQKLFEEFFRDIKTPYNCPVREALFQFAYRGSELAPILKKPQTPMPIIQEEPSTQPVPNTTAIQRESRGTTNPAPNLSEQLKAAPTASRAK